MPVRHSLDAFGLAAATLAATPAFAGEGDEPYEHSALPPIPDGPERGPGPIAAYSVEEREGWLAECRDRMTPRDDGVGGAVIGGVVGGFAGNRIAGRGNRLVGTVVGAGVGAVAGAAIDRAEDGGDAADFCEDYLDRYESSYAGGHSYAYGAEGPDYGRGHGHGMKHYGGYGQAYYGGRVMWVPVKISGGCKPKCDCKTERVVEEWVEQPARRVVPTKRVPIKPTKTVPLKPTKYSK
jgi:hypothetical protein